MQLAMRPVQLALRPVLKMRMLKMRMLKMRMYHGGSDS